MTKRSVIACVAGLIVGICIILMFFRFSGGEVADVPKSVGNGEPKRGAQDQDESSSVGDPKTSLDIKPPPILFPPEGSNRANDRVPGNHPLQDPEMRKKILDSIRTKRIAAYNGIHKGWIDSQELTGKQKEELVAMLADFDTRIAEKMMPVFPFDPAKMPTPAGCWEGEGCFYGGTFYRFWKRIGR